MTENLTDYVTDYVTDTTNKNTGLFEALRNVETSSTDTNNISNPDSYSMSVADYRNSDSYRRVVELSDVTTDMIEDISYELLEAVEDTLADSLDVENFENLAESYADTSNFMNDYNSDIESAINDVCSALKEQLRIRLKDDVETILQESLATEDFEDDDISEDFEDDEE